MRAGLSDADFARQLATSAGERLVSLRESRPDADRDTLKTQGDQLAHRHLMLLLQTWRPEDAVLSEEGVAEETEATKAARLAAHRSWIVDPLDGTREFSEGRDDWAVHVALAVDGVAVLGAVALPAHGITLSTWAPPTLAPPHDGPPRFVISRTRPPAEALAVAGEFGGELIEMGSAGAKAMAVVMGQAEVYLHSGGQYEWDSCAPVAVALAAGLSCTRLDGSPLRYNREDPYLPDLLICRPELVTRVRSALDSGPGGG